MKKPKYPDRKLKYAHFEDRDGVFWTISDEEDFSCNDVLLYSSEGEDGTWELNDFWKSFNVVP